jgi:dTDP-4-dehydrorhamnose 3,5-epimerase
MKRIIKITKLNPFKDHRGKFIETYNKKRFKKKNFFIQDCLSYSRKNVLRGFHGDKKTWKLFMCIHGKVQLAVINYDKKSKDYKQNFDIILSDNKPTQILVPHKYGVAHLVLSKTAIINYKQSTYYGDNTQFTINFKSECLKFKWRSKKIITSTRDNGGIFLK